MFKQKMAAVIALAAMVMPLVSNANVEIKEGGMTINGKQVANVHAGSSFNAVFLADANSGDEIEFVRVSLYDLSNNLVQAPQCVAISPRLVDVVNGQVNVKGIKTVSDLPDGELEVMFETFGISGLSQSNRCDDNNIGTDRTFEGRLFIDHTSTVSNADVVVGGSSSTGTGAGSADEAPSWLAALIAALTSSKKPAVCTGLDAKVNAATPGVTTAANAVLQKHLGTNGYASYMPALYPVQTTSFGFYGSQTSGAVAAALDACN